MSARPVTPVIPSGVRLPARGAGRAGPVRRLPAASAPVIPAAPQDVLYGFGRIDPPAGSATGPPPTRWAGSRETAFRVCRVGPLRYQHAWASTKVKLMRAPVRINVMSCRHSIGSNVSSTARSHEKSGRLASTRVQVLVQVV